MNNDFIFALVMNITPISAIIFVAVLLLYKIYMKIRCRFNACVNCWFCNQNAKVPYLESNSWTCPRCEQYNGFTKDGDYNREIFQQLNCSNASTISRQDYSNGSSELFARSALATPRNGFCNVCNEAQRLKVEKLAQFEPKNEAHFDAELKVYKSQLEEHYRLCDTCDRHLRKVLREKKKMVLGSKFLDFIIKGAETLKQPHFEQMRSAKRQLWKNRITRLILLCALINLACLFNGLPPITRDQLVNTLGNSIGETAFVVSSHLVALTRVVMAYFENLATHGFMIKMGLFLRTVSLMILYSMGLKLPQLVGFNFVALYVLACPFAILALAFGHNILDGFKLTRFTLLVVLWSMFAGGLVSEHLLVAQNVLMFLASLLTLALVFAYKTEVSPKLHDSQANSFHKIYSEDYLSDDETMSLLSQQLNSSAASIRSYDTANRSFIHSPSRAHASSKHTNKRLTKSPITSSMLSLNDMYRSHISPGSSFKSFHCQDDNPIQRPAQYTASMYNFPTDNITRPATLYNEADFYSNNSIRPHSTIFGSSANANTSIAKSTQHAAHPMGMQRIDENLLMTAQHNPPSLYSNNTFAMPSLVPSLHSPFSLSSNAVYQPERPSNLLSPSRFSTTCLAGNASATSWLSGGYFNQSQMQAQRKMPPQQSIDTLRSNFLLAHHRNGLTAIDENHSRDSSQSSGFESQNGRLNKSRENSFCPEANDVAQQRPALPLDSAKSFQPIHADSHYMSSPTLLTQPLSVNCGSNMPTANARSPLATALRQSTPFLRREISDRDSFNFRRINDELPSIKRGDLLKKWKNRSNCLLISD